MVKVMCFDYCLVQQADLTLLPVLLISHLSTSQAVKSLFSQPCLTNKLHLLHGNYTFLISVGLV